MKRLEKLRMEAQTMAYLKKHDANIQKVYSDVNFNQIIADIDVQLYLYNTPFEEMSDADFSRLSSLSGVEFTRMNSNKL